VNIPNRIIQGTRVWVRITPKDLDALHFAARALECLSMEQMDHPKEQKPFSDAETRIRWIISKASP
jgi:hypothetical protein